MTQTLDKSLTIIGVGSSAGGLEAIRELFGTPPPDLPVTFVVVQHMSPHHKSLMTELVARQTPMKVADVQDGIVPQRNVIYITPPKSDIIFKNGKLRLLDPSPDIASPKPSVDRFLLSLADGHGENSMAIILSGTGSDGSYGVQAIREAGGITIAQDGESAKYDGMPQNAVQTGCVDLILRPQDIGTHLKKILSSPRDFTDFRKGELAESPVSDLMQILLARTRVDFREYKQTTIGRRIERRMVALGIETKEEYTQFCRNNPQALDALFKDLLISVTRFFRDKKEFERLKTYLPELLEKRAGGPLRIWIAGCATGEEAYSIAMLVAEALGGPEVPLKANLQIFATDIDKSALQVARRGVYSLAALNDIPKELADKYLIRQNDSVRVVESLRSAILFSDHNVCQDPPFQKVDLLCCRNLLIYFGNGLQHKVLSRFHYAMARNSVLFLGTAESVASSEQLFIQERDGANIFRKRMLHRPERHAYSGQRNSIRPVRRDNAAVVSNDRSTDHYLFEALVHSLGKNAVLVNESYAIVRVFGEISPYIEMKASSNLKLQLDLLRSPLREEARSLVTIALRNKAHRAGVRHLLALRDTDEVRLDVYPVIAPEISERAALVVFNTVTVDHSKSCGGDPVDAADADVSDRIRTLENEVATTREALQQTIEELETSNEELQSLNEEMQSTNEELQATNEEMETSNEELQSTNEELITVNEELQVTAAELGGRTGELTSVIESTPLAILVMDTALQISQASKTATELFKIGNPGAHPHISQCVLPEGYPGLAPLCSEALTLGETIVREFHSDGTGVRLTCSPYFNVHGQIVGVTMITTPLPGLAQEMELVLSNSQFFFLHRTLEGKILRISEKSAQALGLTREIAEGRNLFDLVDASVVRILRQADRDLLEDKNRSRHLTYKVTAPNLEQSVWLSSDHIADMQQQDGETTVYHIGTDISQVVEARDAAEHLVRQMHLLQEMASVGYWAVDLVKNKIHWSREVYRIHGVDPDEPEPELEDAIHFYHPDDIDHVQKAVAKVAENGGSFRFERRLIQTDGTEVNVQSHGVGVENDDGKIIKIIGVFRII